MQSKNVSSLELKVISQKDRFRLNFKDNKYIKKVFKNSTILISGAAGSIGSVFVKSLSNHKFKKIYLLDKDENSLTELNRELITIFNKRQILSSEFICTDLNEIDINLLLENYKITHYLNFAAVKHVRSEDEIITAKYLLNTNAQNFLKIKKIKSNNLKLVFSVSSDKVVEPTSLLGISKKLMEDRIFKFKKINQGIFVSTTRFANVSFSKGSILKYANDNIIEKKIFGVPKKIKRYFITHDEAISLCLTSLLKKSDGKIIVPKLDLIEPPLVIETIIDKIVKYYKFKITKFRKKHLKKNLFYVYKSPNNISGQKLYEKLYESFEKYESKNNKKVIYIQPELLKINEKLFFKKINSIKSLGNLKKYIKSKIKNYKILKNSFKLKNSL